MTELTEMLKKILYEKGATLVGVGDLSELPSEQRNNMPIGISIAVAINPETIQGIKNAPTKEYYEAYQSLNNKLDELVDFGTEYIHDCGYHAYPQSRSMVKVDEEGLNTILPHKTVATRSGIGWIGKCAVLVTKDYGSAIRISSILTDAPLHADIPQNESKCGSCMLCAGICPGQAVKGLNWNIQSIREDFFDAAKCKRTSREIAKRNVGIEMSLCGKCIYICPYTQRYIRSDKGRV